MNTPTRLLLVALAAGTFGLAGVTPNSAFAQENDADDPMAGFTMPEAPPAHDYEAGPDAEGFASMEERVSYAIGVNIGTGLSRNFEEMGATLDGDALTGGIQKATAGEETKLSEAQVESTLQAFQQQMMERQMAEARRAAEENEKEADAFFAENKDADGVTTTDSGLQYKLETEGQGAVPAEGQVVTLNYRGTLLDGTEFDSSYDSPEPAEFPVGAVIPGFNEALLLMPVGSKGTIWIPADLAYGQSPPPGSPIEPGSALSFDLEILGVSDANSMADDGGPAGMDMEAMEQDARGAGQESGAAAGDAMNRDDAEPGQAVEDEDEMSAPSRSPVAD